MSTREASSAIGSEIKAEAYHETHLSPPAAPAPSAAPDRPVARPQRIVVGVDGSDESVAALHWAAEEARWRGAQLEVVHAWSWDHAAPIPMVGPGPGEVRREAEETLQMALQDARLHGVAASGRVVEGHPSAALQRLAAGADLLVVGSRGRGTITSALLGSVSTHCVHHAPCPVVVVPSAHPGRLIPIVPLAEGL
jgi:nucleotide-binding universal stress UspA family protein